MSIKLLHQKFLDNNAELMSLKDIWVKVYQKDKSKTYADIQLELNEKGIRPFAVDDKERVLYLYRSIEKSNSVKKYVPTDPKNLLIWPFDQKRIEEIESKIKASASSVEKKQDKASLFSRMMK